MFPLCLRVFLKWDLILGVHNSCNFLIFQHTHFVRHGCWGPLSNIVTCCKFRQNILSKAHCFIPLLKISWWKFSSGRINLNETVNIGIISLEPSHGHYSWEIWCCLVFHQCGVAPVWCITCLMLYLCCAAPRDQSVNAPVAASVWCHTPDVAPSMQQRLLLQVLCCTNLVLFCTSLVWHQYSTVQYCTSLV